MPDASQDTEQNAHLMNLHVPFLFDTDTGTDKKVKIY